ncbi:hypothetical protein A2592_03140 [Candidatus Kaiserbacteria bacterium RIFOXYD1_FULL_42_15]|uniref:PKD domain-containing protein n=1 Tax=Candidatus Kaiserbacteria bacterium RIFOXYD1_FULL_42_15 TaxID=1798532 RepID=A0A1F6FSD2_9BACT|nr:MAG: hypothetical protein A2592_03140 [Candidatus Kaiserbacteria bacterium RIFOXYD1_FULL_42_15]
MRLALLCSLSIFAFLPAQVSASIEISEIAWMGTTVSTDDEWIELYNNGSDEIVDGWTLTDGLKLNILLTGTIPGQSYVVLERTSDESAPGMAFFIYTGALVNSGATVTLTRSDGNTENEVAGGENWQNIGGDNTTKDTAQRTNNGWITAPGTPGRANATVASPTITTDTSSPSPSSKTSKPSVKTETPKPVVKDSLQLSLIVPSTAYVNQTVGFDVTPSGIDSALIGSLRYYWNFGDLDASNQKKTTHIYTYPGTYVVTLYASLTHKDQTARREITVLPVIASLSKNSVGDIQINNDSPYELDLSNYTLLGSTEIKFPPRTVLLSRSTITVPKARVSGNWGQVVTLSDAKGVKVASTADTKEVSFTNETIGGDFFESDPELLSATFTDNPNSVFASDNEAVHVPPSPSVFASEARQSASSLSPFGFSGAETGSNEVIIGDQNQVTPGSNLDESEGLDEVRPEEVGVPAGTPVTTYWPYLALIILITIATSALFLTKKVE